ncbi:MAG: NAD-dependent epimerase/dehydratase family protein [Proteobacteria bacterium]|nr:NAD-dependent epimerase/dehydratase family protein [Pseudomonadota bacterium]
MPKSPILVTGAAGFIGFAVTRRLLDEGYKVVGLDNLNSYYSPKLKKARLSELARHPKAKNFTFKKLDLANSKAVIKLALATKPSHIIHLAAQAGVRYGLINQVDYLNSNLIGHFTVLQACKALADAKAPIKHLLYASSSSVYGANAQPGKPTKPFAEADDVSRPVSLYAATKRADEMLTHAWAHQFGTPSSGLRFFTVYGPWGRPDMTPLMFTEALYKKQPIKLFNKGDLWRDFTYVDDIVEAILRLMPHAPAATPTPHTLYNLGNQNPVQMLSFIKTLEKVTGKKANLKLEGWPATEVYKTSASTAKLKKAVGWAPSTPLEVGLTRLNTWYQTWAKPKA